MEAYLPYCQADRRYYERPGSGGLPFAFALRDLPEGWSRHVDPLWTKLSPITSRLREQGWKAHVSVVPDSAGAAVDLVGDYCLASGTPFKFLTTPATHLMMNGKYADRGSSGKLITVYPASDDDLRRVVEDLSALLAGFRGPYVLSDLRHRDGPVYVRYGGFVPMTTLDGDGRPVPALRRPDGTLTPDVRAPRFVLPDWVTLPEFLRSDRDPGPAAFPYRDLSALHFSNGGGIYLASDPVTGRRVVLREARPHAGLDGSGDDAVTRLHREAETLRELGDLDFVPGFVETFTAWEHHYLAQEYVEGELLWNFLAARNPLVIGSATDEAVTAYTATVLDLLTQIATHLDVLHRRGWVFADLHPRNVIVRPDGRAALVDFECAYRPGRDRAPTIGCPGFVAPHVPAGAARDEYALNCLRVAAFLPLTMMLDLDPTRAGALVDTVAGLFPVPPAFTRTVRAGLRAPGAAGGDRGASSVATHRRFAGAGDDWHERFGDGDPLAGLVTSIAASIVRSATPEREDRLFPGDPAGLEDGGYTLAHGAAGVLFALRTAGAVVDPAHVDWLARAARRAPVRAGAYDGLHGAALVLDGLGRTEDALWLLDRAPALTMATSLFSGLAGIGLVLRHFAVSTGDTHWRDETDRVTRALADHLDRRDRPPGGQGLLRGGTGPAVFFLRRYADTAEDALLDLARRALAPDVERCVPQAGDEAVLSDGRATLPYLGTGGGGLVEALTLYLGHRPDPHLDGLRAGLLRACRAGFTIEPGLEGGRAGLLAVLARYGPDASDRSAVAAHIRRLAWHAVADGDGGIAFPGRWLLRLSTDLTTGGAGVLLALHAASGAAGAAGAADAAGRPDLPPATWWQATGLPVIG